MKTISCSRIIIGIAFGLGVVCGGLFHVAAHASDASACYTIQDSDARAVCLAKANRRPDICYNVQRADMRSQCLAEVRK